MTTIYIKIEDDEVTVTFAADAIHNSTKMTRSELIGYLTKAEVTRAENND